jgi:hypothetical protein
MTVKELINLLEFEDENKEIVIKEGRYAYSIEDEIYEKTLRAAFGADKTVLVLRAADQLGGI